ncbi:MAG: BolA family protein [Wenzhouxiangellaceae bacterium]
MNEARVARIEALLQRELSPTRLAVIDESHLHVGHAGARDGRGHFRVRIAAEAFAGKPRLARHRMIHAALQDMMETDIHALAIEIEDQE